MIMNLSVCTLQKFLKTLNETILTHKKVNGGAQIGFQVLQNSFTINCFSLMTHNHASWRTDNLSRNNLARKQHNAHVVICSKIHTLLTVLLKFLSVLLSSSLVFCMLCSIVASSLHNSLLYSNNFTVTTDITYCNYSFCKLQIMPVTDD